MNDYRKYNRRMFEVKDDVEVLLNVLEEFSQELSVSISGALGPTSPFLAPAMIMVLENYARLLRKQYPRAVIVADALTRMTSTTEVSIPVPNLEEE